jgi:hypothetical protein
MKKTRAEEGKWLWKLEPGLGMWLSVSTCLEAGTKARKQILRRVPRTPEGTHETYFRLLTFRTVRFFFKNVLF